MARRVRYTNSGGGGWLKLLAFIAVMLLGLALMLSFILNKLGLATDVASWIERVAVAIALVTPLFLSYYKARSLGTAWFVLWIIATVLVVVFYVLNGVGSILWWKS